MTTNNKKGVALSEVQNLIEQIAANSKKIINNDLDKFLHDCAADAAFDLHTYECITYEDINDLKLRAGNYRALLIVVNIPQIGEKPMVGIMDFMIRTQSHYRCEPLLAVYEPNSNINGALHIIAQL